MRRKRVSLSHGYEGDVVAAAKRLLAKVGIDRIPVDLEALARFQGVTEIRDADLGSTDAQLTLHEGGFLIEVNGYASAQRKRFSIAHEIAHTFFNPKVRVFRRTGIPVTIAKDRPENLIEESLCDIAAAELLMPRDTFIAMAANLPAVIQSIEAIAESSGSSMEATALRYATFGPTTCQVAVWGRRYGEIRRKWSRGEPVMTESGFKLREPRTAIQWHLARAYFTNDCVRETELDSSDYPPRRVTLEMKGYGHGRGRYVLTMLRSGFKRNANH